MYKYVIKTICHDLYINFIKYWKIIIMIIYKYNVL